MLYTIPDYYKEFKCTADKCEDTCCAGWQIVIDEESLERYKKVRGFFKWRMLRSVDWKNGVFKQDAEKRCAFLNEQNLCDLYKACGEKSLCKTCGQYPRHIEEFEGVREITLSISCPEVARILMARKTPVTFQSYEEAGEEEYEDFDPFLFSILEDARKEGKVAKSKDLTQAFELVVLFLLLKVFIGYVGERMINLFDSTLGRIAEFYKVNQMGVSVQAVSTLITNAVLELLLIVWPFFVFGFVITLLVTLYQVGWKVSTKPMEPKLSKFNPINGFKRITTDRFTSLLNISSSESAGRGKKAVHTRNGEYLGSKIYDILKPSGLSYRVTYDLLDNTNTFAVWG